MTTSKLDLNTQNIDTGIFMTKSQPIDFAGSDIKFAEMATYIKSVIGGTLVWKNNDNGEVGSWNLEAGEIFLGRCDEILASATVNGIVETTALGRYYWGATANDMRKNVR